MSVVVLAHDYVTQHGGAERVALSMTSAFPTSPLVTSFYAPERTFAGFADVDIHASALNGVTALRTDPRRALPLLPGIWDRLRAPQADVVLCSSSGWSHGLRTQARKVVYCHNPPRWLYQPQDYMMGHGAGYQAALRALRPGLIRWDQQAASSVDLYLANSAAVARRIRRAYGVEAQVVHPPVLVDVHGASERPAGVPDDFFLVVGRSRGYKNVATTCAAFAAMPDQHLVVVGTERESWWPANVHAFASVTEAQLRFLYARATALVATAFEDFGLTVIEAAAFGTPTVALAAGGYLETVDDGVSGRFIAEPTSAAIQEGVRAELDEPTDRLSTLRHADQFSESNFHRRLRDAVAGVAREPAVSTSTTR